MAKKEIESIVDDLLQLQAELNEIRERNKSKNANKQRIENETNNLEECDT